MARFRLSRLAERDLGRLLAASTDYWGEEARQRYAALIAAAMRQVAADPRARTSRDRRELLPGLRSLHLRHARIADPAEAVRRPVHVLFYRLDGPDLVEIVRVLHERMEPSRQLDADC